MKKRHIFLSVITAFSLVLTLIPVAASADDYVFDMSENDDEAEVFEFENDESGINFAALEERSSTPEELGYVPGEIIVIYDDSYTKPSEALIEEMDGDIQSELAVTDDCSTLLVGISDDTTVAEAIELYESDPAVISAEPNMLLEIQEDPVNDPYYYEQYYLMNDDGDSCRGTSTVSAWELADYIDFSDVTVAVLDTGACKTNPDLENTVNWGKSVEIIEAHDGSGNLITRELLGDGFDGGDTAISNASYHGTHVTGIIAAEADNGVGIAGAASVLKDKMDLFVVDVCYDHNVSDMAHLIKGIRYAADNGAQVINISIGGSTGSDILNEGTSLAAACRNAADSGITIVCSGGNAGNSNINIPSDYSSAISVVNTDKYGNRYQSSSYNRYKELAAPGAGIYSTYSDYFANKTGTSQSSPMVAAAVAMMYSADPEMNFEKAVTILRETATDIGEEGFDIYTGYGLLNAEKALIKAAFGDETRILKQPENTEAQIGETSAYCIKTVNAVSFQWQYSKDGAKWYKSTAQGSDSEIMSLTVKANNIDNLYRCRITGSDGSVQYTDTVKNIEAEKTPVITVQPAYVTGKAGDTVNYGITAKGAEVYQWYYSKDGGLKWYKSSAQGCDTATLTITLNNNNIDSLYRCRVTGKTGTYVVSEPAGVKESLVITGQPESVCASVGETVSFAVEAGGAASYQWYYSKDNGSKWYKSAAEGCTSGVVSFKMKSTNFGMLYRCRLTGSDGTVLYSEPATVFAN